MGESTDTLTRDIESTRESLSRDVDELTDKVSPGRIVQRQKEAAGSRLRDVRDKIMGTAGGASDSISSAGQNIGDTASGAVDTAERQVRGNPLAAGLVAFGAGMVLSALLPATDAEAQAAGKLVDTAKEQGQPLVEEAKQAGQEIAQNLKGSATEAAQDLKESAQESVSTVTDEARDAGGEIKDAAPGT